MVTQPKMRYTPPVGGDMDSYPLALPELQSEMMFTFLIHCFGWVAGIGLVIMALICTAFRPSFQKSARSLRKSFSLQPTDLVGNAVCMEYPNVFGPCSIKFVCRLALLLVFSGSVVLFQFMAIGLMLSVYRRRDLGAWCYS